MLLLRAIVGILAGDGDGASVLDDGCILRLRVAVDGIDVDLAGGVGQVEAAVGRVEAADRAGELVVGVGLRRSDELGDGLGLSLRRIDRCSWREFEDDRLDHLMLLLALIVEVLAGDGDGAAVLDDGRVFCLRVAVDGIDIYLAGVVGQVEAAVGCVETADLAGELEVGACIGRRDELGHGLCLSLRRIDCRCRLAFEDDSVDHLVLLLRGVVHVLAGDCEGVTVLEHVCILRLALVVDRVDVDLAGGVGDVEAAVVCVEARDHALQAKVVGGVGPRDEILDSDQLGLGGVVAVAVRTFLLDGNRRVDESAAVAVEGDGRGLVLVLVLKYGDGDGDSGRSRFTLGGGDGHPACIPLCLPGIVGFDGNGLCTGTDVESQFGRVHRDGGRFRFLRLTCCHSNGEEQECG